MGPLVFSTFAQQNNWPFGGAVSFVLMTATVILTIVASVGVQRRYR
jgi:putative spermidine/putrescine transport system permease protein